MINPVVLARCPSYDEDEVLSAVRNVLQPLGGMERYVRPGMRVFVKLNLLSARLPRHAVTTHPAVAKAVTTLVQECGATPVLGDSPAGLNTPSSYAALLRTTGIMGVIEETGAEWAYCDGETLPVSSDHALTFHRLPIARQVLDADVVIGVPKLKAHEFTGFSGAVELLYGYLPGIAKAAYTLHAGKDPATFADLLLDLHTSRPPVLSIMDAVVGMEGNGPHQGEPREIGLVLASPGCTTLDFVAASVAGLDPLDIPTIARAYGRGEGPGSLSEVTLFGPSLDDVSVRDFVPAPFSSHPPLPSFAAKIAGRFLAVRPVIERGRCVACGACVAKCPSHAMVSVAGPAPRIEYGRCIRCFCCYEICPEGAVEVGEPALRRVLG
jgi:uncharacterized protein (DUF362 family)/Pyruvate/2-oxoacid:ferredoxin oxidoreductase delta subunit